MARIIGPFLFRGNMELKEVTAQSLSTLLDFVKQGAEFVKEQAPLLAQEIIKYEIVSSSIYIVVGVVLLLAVLVGILIALKTEDGDTIGISCILGLVTTLVAIGIISCNTLNLTKALTAPRLVIIEQIQRMK